MIAALPRLAPAILLAAVAVSARAAPPATPAAPPAAAIDTVAVSDAAAPVQPQAEEPKLLDADALAQTHAGADTNSTVLTQQQLSATVSNNTITVGTLSSGAVNFDANALAGFSGVGNFVINTGSNNALQGGVNISIVTTPPQP
jgi:hypothetical protein